MNNLNITKNFKLSEFQCRGGSQLVKIDSKLVNLLQILRDRLDTPLVVNSGYRTPEYNKKVNGINNSLHVQGKAADISKRNLSISDSSLVSICKEIGFNGIIIYDTFIHLDTGDNKYYLDKRTRASVGTVNGVSK